MGTVLLMETIITKIYKLLKNATLKIETIVQITGDLL